MSDTTQATTLAPEELAKALPGDAGKTGPVTMTPLSQTELAGLMDAMPREPASKANGPRHAAPQDLVDKTTQAQQTGYTPVFSDQVRTIIYVAGLIASIIGLGFMCFGHPEIGGFISTAAGAIAAGFGVAYNPLRLAGK